MGNGIFFLSDWTAEVSPAWIQFSVSLDLSFTPSTAFPITFSAISITFRMAFAIRSSNNRIAALTISPNSSGFFPFCSTDSFTLSVISVFFNSKIFDSDRPLTIARSTALFHSVRISLSAFISSAFGLFLPTFFVARYGPFLSKMLSLSLSSSAIWLIRSV